MFPIMMLLKFLSQIPFDHLVLSKKSRNHSVIQERLLLTEVLSKTLLTAVFSTFYSSNCYVENNLLQSFSWPWAIEALNKVVKYQTHNENENVNIKQPR